MSKRNGDPRFYELLERLADLHDKKQADYGRRATDAKAADPFANVRASEDWGIEPWVGAMIRANDKVRRLQAAAMGSELANEGIADSLEDLAVYAMIARILYGEAEGEYDAQGSSAWYSYDEDQDDRWGDWGDVATRA